MRIGVDCHILSGKYQGSRTYLLNLYNAVLKQQPGADLVFLGNWTDSKPFGPGANYASYQSSGRFSRLTVGTQQVASEWNLDAVHVGYVRPLWLRTQSIVTLYDILFESHPEFFDAGFVLRSRLLCRWSARRASQVHTISDFSRTEIIDRYGLPEEKVSVIPCGVDTDRYHSRSREEAREKVMSALGVKDYLLTVGRLEPRKNHIGLIHAYAQLKARLTECPKLVIVGQRDFGDKPIFEAVARLKLDHDVKIIEACDDSLLPEVYRAAKLFVYPSFAEGFGLPPLEALASGVPVITSNSAAIPEVVGDAAVLVNPHDVQAIAGAMESVLRQPEKAESLRQRGPGQAGKWSWDEAAAKYLRAIEDLSRHRVWPVRMNARPAASIAFCGTRGVPASYGGFETAVDEITRRFVDQGHRCEVFCRDTNARQRRSEHEGRRLIYVRGHRSRTLDTFVSAIQTGLHLWKHRRQYDHVFWFNNANLPGILLTALARIPMTVNTDGLEWRRAKWSWPFKAYYYLASMLVALVSRRLVSDSRAIQNYYRRHFLKKTSFIPYGAPPSTAVPPERAQEILNRFGLEAGKYFLQVTRIEPDNLPLNAAEAFARSRAATLGYRMVFVGYKEATPYAQRLISYDGHSGIQVREAIYDREVLHVLRTNCYCYVHGNSVGGTNPALLEAMATCPRVMAIDCEFSREVLDACGEYFDPSDIASTFDRMLQLPEEGEKLRARVSGFYQWDAVAESYLRLANGHDAAYTPHAPEAVPPNRLKVIEGSK